VVVRCGTLSHCGIHDIAGGAEAEEHDGDDDVGEGGGGSGCPEQEAMEGLGSSTSAAWEAWEFRLAG